MTFGRLCFKRRILGVVESREEEEEEEEDSHSPMSGDMQGIPKVEGSVVVS